MACEALGPNYTDSTEKIIQLTFICVPKATVDEFGLLRVGFRDIFSLFNGALFYESKFQCKKL